MSSARLAIAATVLAAAAACSRPPTAGFWFTADALVLPSEAQVRLGAPLTAGEAATIARLSRVEIDRAFSGLRVTVSDRPASFWRVTVVRSLVTGRTRQLPHAGESMPMGFLGGGGAVGLDVVASSAVRYAPPGASRSLIVDAIGRGIGRVAVHEFMHLMLGASAGHNDADAGSYEFGSPERRAQYYGQLRWTTAWPELSRRFGTGQMRAAR